jgi:predicted nucleotidyltransferase
MVKAASEKKRKLRQGQASPPDLSWFKDVDDRDKRLSHIQSLCERIVGLFKPEKVILFGSQAHGIPTSSSDIDLLVVMPYTGSPLQKAASILSELQVWMPIDLIVRSAADIEKRLSVGDRFTKEILERGKVLYEAPIDIQDSAQ